ncbi:UNVERIFIED_CONTAM: hypothetical protein FKN15_014340 [Acipenser sinensis]
MNGNNADSLKCVREVSDHGRGVLNKQTISPVLITSSLSDYFMLTRRRLPLLLEGSAARNPPCKGVGRHCV